LLSGTVLRRNGQEVLFPCTLRQGMPDLGSLLGKQEQIAALLRAGGR